MAPTRTEIRESMQPIVEAALKRIKGNLCTGSGGFQACNIVGGRSASGDAKYMVAMRLSRSLGQRGMFINTAKGMPAHAVLQKARRSGVRSPAMIKLAKRSALAASVLSHAHTFGFSATSRMVTHRTGVANRESNSSWLPGVRRR